MKLPSRRARAGSSPKPEGEISLWWLGAPGLFALLSAVLVGWSPRPLLTACAALVFGFSLGFVFGVPRAPTDGSEDQVVTPLRTNLEQVSDWLTKIIVGVGLTQLANAPEALMGTAKLFAATDGPEQVALYASIIVVFALTGNLVGFLSARLFLGDSLRLADAAVLVRRQLEAHEEADAQALAAAKELVRLDDEVGDTQRDEVEARARRLAAAASSSVKVSLFYIADEQMRGEPPGPMWARAVPILEGLVDDDAGERFHRNRYLLAMALLYGVGDTVARKRAAALLDQAIRIRDKAAATDYRQYEYARAAVTIKSDPAFSKRKPSTEAVRARVRELLNAAAGRTGLLKDPDPDVEAWLALNGSSPDASASAGS